MVTVTSLRSAQATTYKHFYNWSNNETGFLTKDEQ
jgi:hypothetical protein